jgi:protein-disulfide isomerase
MRLPRRSVLAAMAASLASPALAQGLAPNDPRLAERGIGRPDAPVRVQEFFSLTCSHCAAFHRETFPAVKRQLVETGTVRLVWRDFPLDQLALTAAVVARSLPPDRYEGFIGALLSSQDRWAFGGGDPIEALAKMAALAGMSRAQFDAARQDQALARAILEGRMKAEQEFNVNATPSFVFSHAGKNKVQPGAISFDRFQQLVAEAKQA